MVALHLLFEYARSMKNLLFSTILCLFSFVTVVTAGDNALSKSEKADGWKLLFNGKDLTDWKVDKWNPDSISVEDGAIKQNGAGRRVGYLRLAGARIGVFSEDLLSHYYPATRVPVGFWRVGIPD